MWLSSLTFYFAVSLIPYFHLNLIIYISHFSTLSLYRDSVYTQYKLCSFMNKHSIGPYLNPLALINNHSIYSFLWNWASLHSVEAKTQNEHGGSLQKTKRIFSVLMWLSREFWKCWFTYRIAWLWNENRVRIGQGN